MIIYNSLIDRLKNQHEAIPFIISKAEKKLHFHPQPAKWSIHDNIAHLSKYQPVFLDRINKIVASDQPVFERYSAETDPDFESWRKWETNRLLSVLNDDRIKIYQRIMNLSEVELNLIGVHKKFGALNILEWTEFFLLHEAHHMFTMFQITNSKENNLPISQ